MAIEEAYKGQRKKKTAKRQKKSAQKLEGGNLSLFGERKRAGCAKGRPKKENSSKITSFLSKGLTVGTLVEKGLRVKQPRTTGGGGENGMPIKIYSL